MQKTVANINNKNPLTVVTQISAFIGANGMANVGVQILPSAISKANGKSVLFGGSTTKGSLWGAMQPQSNYLNFAGTVKVCNANGQPYPNGYTHRGQILWACVNGLPSKYLGANAMPIPKQGVAPITTIPTTPQIIPLSQVQLISKVSGASILANATTQTHCNQNVLAGLINGAFSYTKTANNTLGTCFAQLVTM